MSVPATVIYFTMYEQIRDFTMSVFVPPLHSYYVPMFSGAAARGMLTMYKAIFFSLLLIVVQYFTMQFDYICFTFFKSFFQILIEEI